MSSFRLAARLAVFTLAFALLNAPFALLPSRAQSRRVPTQEPQKKNQRPEQQPQPHAGQQQDEPAPPRDAIEDPDPVKVSTALVNVEAVVINKKTKQIVTGLKRENFAVFEDGQQQQLTNFSTPEAPITVAMVLEYSNLMDRFLRGDYNEPGRYEVLRPMAMFLSGFIKPPEDYVSVIAYDMRVTPITDFTNDPSRISATVNLLLRNRPVSSEAKPLRRPQADARRRQGRLRGARKLARAHGRVRRSPGPARAAQGRLPHQHGHRHLQQDQLGSGAQDRAECRRAHLRHRDREPLHQEVRAHALGRGRLGGATTPGRLTLYQAQNQLNTIAKESGGLYFPITFEGELNSALQSINAMMRNQYSLGYAPASPRDGKRHKIQVKVDVDGDGQLDDKDFTVKSREYYNAPKS
jgi:VWFA-related protein